ncbi:hypothetical protein [Streptomyces carpinensis]|uniref:Uncharacterized protein n=1 Tax=Streptomyces carpinensis TaxID=66369 RepID=A0ABV1WIF0_9ACTN|nr:hypothetical protein [Streptomyces carpinensis]
MTGPSSTPRGERVGTRGRTREREIVSNGEVIVDLNADESPFGWRDVPDPARAQHEGRRDRPAHR